MFSRFSVILASSADGGIGYQGGIPWPTIKEDMENFKRLTVGKGNFSNAVIMGRKTWESIPEKFRPLPDRVNIVISHSFTKQPTTKSVVYCQEFSEALEFCHLNHLEAWVIGGAAIYEQAVKKFGYLCNVINHTLVKQTLTSSLKFDTFFDMKVFKDKKSIEISKTTNFSIREYNWNENHDEYKYLSLCSKILSEGESIHDQRTGKRVLRLTCPEELVFDVSENLPLLTTKKMAIKSTLRELLWFIGGIPDSKILEKKGCNFWKGNTEKKVIESLGLSYEEGDCGPLYPFQWRHCGEDYKGCHEEYKGIDQLDILIRGLKENPSSRRHIITAWIPQDLKKMVLPPCHCFSQFFVEYKDGKPYGLSCKVTQRSADVFLGLPVNIASYALLLRMISYLTGYKPVKLVMSLGDAHIYGDHIDQMKTQTLRTPYPFPTLEIVRKGKNIKTIDDFEEDNFVVSDYAHHPALHGVMAV